MFPQTRTGSKLSLHEVIRNAGPPLESTFATGPDWCQEELGPAAKVPLKISPSGGLTCIGKFLEFDSCSFMTPSQGQQTINGKTHPMSLHRIHDALATKQEYVMTNDPSGLWLPSRLGMQVTCKAFPSLLGRQNMLIPEREPSPVSSDADQEACILDGSTPTKLNAETGRPRVLMQPVGLGIFRKHEDLSLPPSQCFSSEPELSPALSVDYTQTCRTAVSVLLKQVPADRLRALLKQLTTESNSQTESEQALEYSKRDHKVQCARQVATLGGGLSGHATVMIQQVPFKYSQSKLLTEFHASGFEGTYDFFYLPANARNHGNRGFGFINFLSAGLAQKFYSKYHGQKLIHHEGSLPIAVIPADVQGFEESAKCFFSSWQLRKKKRASVPVFLKPLPAYLREQTRENKGAGHKGSMA